MWTAMISMAFDKSSVHDQASTCGSRGLDRRSIGREGLGIIRLIRWLGDTLIEEVDMIVFVYAPTPIRMERLISREWHGD
ncbi:hypothetical protein FHS20_003707 [Phyllobacterium endophyticum]|nr:hypothetical protein [Phyllobacterium endophyticum]